MERTSDQFSDESVFLDAPEASETADELLHDWELRGPDPPGPEPEGDVALGVDEGWYSEHDGPHPDEAPEELLDEETDPSRPAIAVANDSPLLEALVELERGAAGLIGEAEEGEASQGPGPGVSPIAVQGKKQWDAADRPSAWIGRVYGLVVHTTGGGLPASAQDKGVYHTVRAVDHYTGSHGCHYVNGWRGVAGGDLLQVANEREQAAGVGVTNPKNPSKDQRRSIELGRFESDLPPILVQLWRRRWPGRDHSLSLLPGTKTANACYVHVECVPCVYHYRGKLITAAGAEPLRPGLRFTAAQHDAVAALACDLARRNGWPPNEQWWRTPRLLGHEDLTPISRHDRLGGWDPGWLREKPYFDFDAVYQAIERIQRGDPGAAILPATSRPSSLLGALGTIADRFRSMVGAGQELAAVALARQRGVHDTNELTNLVFFGRHPEMVGRKIGAGDTALAREWLQIRDAVVKPAVRSINSLNAASSRIGSKSESSFAYARNRSERSIARPR
jgi:hypothetical protein